MIIFLKREFTKRKRFLSVIISLNFANPVFASHDTTLADDTERTNKTVVIFTIDGGGTRGILPAVMLDALQKKVGQELTPLVHMWGGTSVGGIEALMLNTPSSDDPTKMLRCSSSRSSLANSASAPTPMIASTSRPKSARLARSSTSASCQM